MRPEDGLREKEFLWDIFIFMFHFRFLECIFPFGMIIPTDRKWLVTRDMMHIKWLNPYFRDLLTLAMNHLLIGMMLQAPSQKNKSIEAQIVSLDEFAMPSEVFFFPWDADMVGSSIQSLKQSEI